MLEDRLVPAMITVSSLADAGPNTLRAAITQADLDTTPDTITFAPTVSGTITLVSALPVLSGAITIEGPGQSVLTVARSKASGTPDFDIFNVLAGAEVAISGLTISGGNGDIGGGIDNAGTLTLTNSTVSENSADLGAGINNSGVLTVSDSIISHNGPFDIFLSNASGGGIENSGTLTVTNSTISDNSAFAEA
jgi:hypothetical protein